MIGNLLGPVNFYGRPRPVLALHCYIIQAGAFAIAAYLFMSWDFSGMALMPADAFTRYVRPTIHNFWKTPWFYWTTLQYIYEFVPRPTLGVLHAMQMTTLVALFCGLFGIFPRMAAWTAFLIGTHLVGMLLIASDTIDASTTVMLFMLFIVALFPPGAHYQIGKPAQPMASSTNFHGPVFILLFFMNAYYFYSGLNKITDYGVSWVLDAHTELWSRSAIENSLFVSSYSTSLWFNSIMSIKALAFIAAFLIFFLELIAPITLFLPRRCPVFLIFFAAMHVSIYLSLGYGYWTNTGADLMLLPYTAIVARFRSYQGGGQAIGAEQPAE